MAEFGRPQHVEHQNLGVAMGLYAESIKVTGNFKIN